MVVISGLFAGSALCRLRRMEARSCCVGLAGCPRDAMETAGGVSTIGISRGIAVDEVSRKGDETMVMAGVSGWGLSERGQASPVHMVASLAGAGSSVEMSGRRKASSVGIMVVIEGSDSGIVPSTMAVVGGVSVVNVRLARTWRLMMRAWRMRLRAR